MGSAVVWTGHRLSIAELIFAPICHANNQHFIINMMMLLLLYPYADAKITLTAYICGVVVQGIWWHCFFKHTAFGVLGISTVVYSLYGYYFCNWLVISQLIISYILERYHNDVGVSILHISGFVCGIGLKYVC